MARLTVSPHLQQLISELTCSHDEHAGTLAAVEVNGAPDALSVHEWTKHEMHAISLALGELHPHVVNVEFSNLRPRTSSFFCFWDPFLHDLLPRHDHILCITFDSCNLLAAHFGHSFASAICQNSVLECLRITSCFVAKDLFTAIASSVKQSKCLEQLCLCNTPLESHDIVSAMELLTNHAEDSSDDNEMSLQELRLDGCFKTGCSMSSQAINSVFHMIQKNNSINFLGLGRNNLNDPNIRDLAMCLCKNACIETLVLDGNPVTDDSAQALVDTLAKSSILETVTVNAPSFVSMAMKQQLHDWEQVNLTKKSAMHKLHQHPDNARDSLWPVILQTFSSKTDHLHTAVKMCRPLLSNKLPNKSNRKRNQSNIDH